MVVIFLGNFYLLWFAYILRMIVFWLVYLDFFLIGRDVVIGLVLLKFLIDLEKKIIFCNCIKIIIEAFCK